MLVVGMFEQKGREADFQPVLPKLGKPFDVVVYGFSRQMKQKLRERRNDHHHLPDRRFLKSHLEWRSVSIAEFQMLLWPLGLFLRLSDRFKEGFADAKIS